MKKFIFILLLTFLSLYIFITPSMADSRYLTEGLYGASDLNLSQNATHTVQNNSDTEYAFIMIFDSNQLTQQYMLLKPESKEYILVPIELGYKLLVVTNDSITIN
ncbi:hypothetical protein [Clostridium chromiireducens]|uniref:Uncharacterized protein n=1 Tax=Clostridium chromiireducens TaxID=225345 RepID=A0A1V4J1N1_9CLOT|nr:hypothetical protein [Clostridium chromiireducens]OPJ65925.1 hypothetical protein CLCHR_02810 [Clostridium chromiireducens]RII35403.1 hypothetical protein D2A34_09380 [Clostridium chromiireducens]